LTIYKGNWKDGKIYGFGIAVYSCGDSYEGEFEGGCRNGCGKYVLMEGMEY